MDNKPNGKTSMGFLNIRFARVNRVLHGGTATVNLRCVIIIMIFPFSMQNLEKSCKTKVQEHTHFGTHLELHLKMTTRNV